MSEADALQALGPPRTATEASQIDPKSFGPPADTGGQPMAALESYAWQLEHYPLRSKFGSAPVIKTYTWKQGWVKVTVFAVRNFAGRWKGDIPVDWIVEQHELTTELFDP